MPNIQIEDSALWPEVQAILNSDIVHTRYNLKGMLHTVDADTPILKITTLDIIRDYVENISDIIHIEFKMGLGDYMSRLYPYRNNLEISIKRTLLNNTSSTQVPNTDVTIERFKAIFLADVNPNTQISDLKTYDTESLNKIDILDVKLQLMHRSIEPLRTKTAQGVFKNVTQKQVIYNILGGESMKVRIDGKPSIDAIDIVEPDNPIKNQFVVIKSGVHAVSIPSYLQEHMHGVYNAGIGTYLQTFKGLKTWFVYPLFNTERFKEDVEKIIFYSLPKDRFPALDKTSKTDGSVTKILVTSSRLYKDTGEASFMSDGSGFRMANADSFMTKPVEIVKGVVKGIRRKINYETTTLDREDGLNYAPASKTTISSNPYPEYSKVVARKVGRVSLTWENARHDIIYPGMPCKYVYLNEGKVVELQAIILYVHSYESLYGQGISSSVYKSACQITIAVEPIRDPIASSLDPFGIF